MLRFGTRWRILLLLLILPLGFLASCGVRTIYVRAGQPVRLRETLHNVKVWVADKDGVWVESTMDVPEGWYALSDEGVK